MIYTYSQANRLEEPHAYMYTQFHGEEFLEAYLSSRLDAVNWPTEGDHGRTELDESLVSHSLLILERLFNVKSVEAGKKFKRVLANGNLSALSQNNNNGDNIFEAAKLLTLMTTEKSVSTLDLTQSLIAVQLLNIQDANTKVWIDRLVQRFEVTKKLFEAYSPGFRKGEGSNAEVRLYWLFALSLSLFYARSSEIKYLSTLLKVSDLLCSLPVHMFEGEVPEHGLKTVLSAEIVSVLLLTEEKGIQLELK